MQFKAHFDQNEEGGKDLESWGFSIRKVKRLPAVASKGLFFKNNFVDFIFKLNILSINISFEDHRNNQHKA